MMQVLGTLDMLNMSPLFVAVLFMLLVIAPFDLKADG